MVSNLALFCFSMYLATFQRIGRFFPNHLVTLPWPLLSFVLERIKETCLVKTEEEGGGGGGHLC